MPGLIFLLSCAAFLPALRAGFAWDDVANLIDNRAYRRFDWTHIKWMLSTTYMGPYQPLSWASLGLDFHLWGMNARGFHLTNILLHAANSVVFYFVSRELLSRAQPEAESRDIAVGAAFSALFFSVHPLRVESVAWITERRDVLAGLFGLLATLNYLRGRLGRALILYGACVLSKVSGVALPLAWLIIDFYPSGRLTSWIRLREALVEKALFFVIAAAAAMLAVTGQWTAGNLKGLDELGVGARLAQAVIGLGFYLRKTLWPSRLSPLYRPPAELAVFSWPVLASLLTIGGVALALRWARVSRRAQAALWAYYVVCLLPVLGLLQNGPQLAADRYSYLSCLGWALLAGASGRRALRTCGLSVVLALGVLCWRQTTVWRDDDSLWQHALKVDPESVPARLNYGLALARKRRLFDALSVYQEAEALSPDNAAIFTHHGWALLELKRYAEAEGILREAVRLAPALALPRTYLGAVLLQEGRPEEALEQLIAADRLEPGSAQAEQNVLAARQAVEDAK